MHSKLGSLKTWMKVTGIRVSDAVSDFVGSWAFVFLYTFAMLLWIALHVTGVLHIDSPDFIKWNLWLSYFAGTQASIVLMSNNRLACRDRKKLDKSFEIDIETLDVSKDVHVKLIDLMEQVAQLEEILDSVLKGEEDEGKREDR